MKLLSWDVFPQEIEAYTVTKYFGDMSFHHPNPTKVLHNRQTLANYLHTELSLMIAPQQTHTNNFKKVTLQEGGSNMKQVNAVLQNTDALYTKDSDLFLITFHADCTPILLYCRDQGIIASIHSGWLGTTKQITSVVVKHLITKENCNPKEMYAYIGPSINKENFEVKEDVISCIQNMDFDTSIYYEKKDAEHYLLDNKGLNMQQLCNIGVPREQITISSYCTIADNHLFYSHRKKETGRSISIIKKKKAST